MKYCCAAGAEAHTAGSEQGKGFLQLFRLPLRFRWVSFRQ
ncbi:hypothetical protein SAMN05216175_103157 [Neptunomonas qingdaonensis]|uniref:Uncharacterized protein n=1 Tax=Neptunomonas qingdaonensis TaxID=1045558 RepID=A0A1I2NX04_9GAMM|nr:hypothetical protein SAMN05216175_103157 [Neptunomonas qingdaonensis]